MDVSLLESEQTGIKPSVSDRWPPGGKLYRLESIAAEAGSGKITKKWCLVESQ
jgi:hypothetical protein